MDQSEVIVLSIPEDKYFQYIIESVKYAVISLPFTINRMKYNDEYSLFRRIKRIMTGKLSEHLFFHYMNENNIEYDTSECITPFYQIDQGDFKFKDRLWDIKNVFITKDVEDYTQLPALIPADGQWQSRYHRNFLFTFMINRDFFHLRFSDEQHQLLNKLYEKYQGKPQSECPFDENDFWESMSMVGYRKSPMIINVYRYPKMILCGYADEHHYGNFDLYAERSDFWGVLKTRIDNMGVLNKELPSIKSLLGV